MATIPSTQNLVTYDLPYTGTQVEQALGLILEGGINQAVNDAQAAASASAASATSAAAAAQTATNQAANASSSANNADASATDAESWAVGETGTREGENTNNSKYWADIARTAATSGGIISVNGKTAGVDGNVTLNASDVSADAQGTGESAVSTHNSASTAHSTLFAKKAGKSTIVSATLAASSWTGTASPFSYTLSVSGVTTTSNQEILPSLIITQEQLEALQGANIVDGGQASGSITLKAFGEKPTIDIPIRVIKRGDA